MHNWTIIPLAIIAFLSQAASRVEESSDDFSQGVTAAVPNFVETTVISELVVTSTLLLPGDIYNILTVMYIYLKALSPPQNNSRMMKGQKVQ